MISIERIEHDKELDHAKIWFNIDGRTKHIKLKDEALEAFETLMNALRMAVVSNETEWSEAPFGEQSLKRVHNLSVDIPGVRITGQGTGQGYKIEVQDHDGNWFSMSKVFKINFTMEPQSLPELTITQFVGIPEK